MTALRQRDSYEMRAEGSTGRGRAHRGEACTDDGNPNDGNLRLEIADIFRFPEKLSKVFALSQDWYAGDCRDLSGIHIKTDVHSVDFLERAVAPVAYQ